MLFCCVFILIQKSEPLFYSLSHGFAAPAPSEREVASRMRCRKEFCSSSFFIYTIYPRLLAQKTQKVRVRALKKVVVTQTLPVRVPSWPICLAMT